MNRCSLMVMPSDAPDEKAYNIGQHMEFPYAGKVEQIRHADGATEWKIWMHDTEAPLDTADEREFVLKDELPDGLKDSSIRDAALVINKSPLTNNLPQGAMV